MESKSQITTYTEVIEDGKVIRRHRVVTSETNGAALTEGEHNEDKHEDKKTKTRIPVSKFRQTVEKVRAERRGSKNKEQESHIPVRRSSIPKPKRGEIKPPTIKKEIIISKTEVRKEAQPEDEFDKIYAEMVVNTTEANIEDNILNPRVDDPELLDSTFEEIIHDYDEHKVEPLEVEVVRRSKIPFLKRKSQQDIDLSSQAERTSKIIAVRDKLRLRHSLTKSEDFERELDRELNELESKHPDMSKTTEKVEESKASPLTDTKTEKGFQHEVISSPNSKVDIKTEFTKTISTSNDTENTQSSSVVQTVTVKEFTTNESVDKKDKQFLVEENIVKGAIKIGIPVFDSYTHDYSETSETSKTVEVKKVLSYTSNTDDEIIKTEVANNDVKHIKAETFENHFARQIDVSFTTNIDNDNERQKINKLMLKKDQDKNNSYSIEPLKVEMIKEPVKEEVMHTMIKDQDIILTEKTKEKPENEEDVIQLKGKVSRLISKIDSKEIIETETNKRESINELTKKKTVLSKIAMFERPVVEAPVKLKTPQMELPKLVTKDLYKVEHIHLHTPLIVDEVFKPFQGDIDLSNEGNNAESPLNKNESTTFEKAERVSVTTPSIAHYAVENKVQIESMTADEDRVAKCYSSQNSLVQQSIFTQVNAQSKIDTDNIEHKTEIATAGHVSTPIQELHMPKIYDAAKLQSKDQRITNDARKLGNDVSKERNDSNKSEDRNDTDQDEPPTPGFRTVSELLRSFESKPPKRTYTRRYVSKDFSAAKIADVKNDALHFNAEYSSIENKETKFESLNEYKSLDDVFTSDIDINKLKLRQEEDLKRAKSLAELDLGDAVKGKVNNLIIRMNSVERAGRNRKTSISVKEMPRKRSVSEKIALFEVPLLKKKNRSAKEASLKKL